MAHSVRLEKLFDISQWKNCPLFVFGYSECIYDSLSFTLPCASSLSLTSSIKSLIASFYVAAALSLTHLLKNYHGLHNGK